MVGYTCQGCGKHGYSKRASRKTCSAACRKRVSRAGGYDAAAAAIYAEMRAMRPQIETMIEAGKANRPSGKL